MQSRIREDKKNAQLTLANKKTQTLFLECRSLLLVDLGRQLIVIIGIDNIHYKQRTKVSLCVPTLDCLDGCEKIADIVPVWSRLPSSLFHPLDVFHPRNNRTTIMNTTHFKTIQIVK
jgi:hypothetical protein